MVYTVGVSWSQALRLVVKVRQRETIVQTVGPSQSEVHMGRGESGDCLVTIVLMMLECSGSIMYLKPLHYLARANMQSGLLTKYQTISNDRLALL